MNPFHSAFKRLQQETPEDRLAEARQLAQTSEKSAEESIRCLEYRLKPGVVTEFIGARLALALDYWKDVGSLNPELQQVCQLHQEMFEGVMEDSVVGRIKEKANSIGNLTVSAPDEVERHFQELQTNADKLIARMNPAPVENADPNNPAHWPAPDDHAAWVQRAQFIAWYHARLMFIHPFSDGNGRVARAIAWEQARRLFPLVARNGYGLREVDEKGNPYCLSSTDRPGLETERYKYTEAMLALTKGDGNLFYLMAYFMFQPGIKIPFPQDFPFPIR